MTFSDDSRLGDRPDYDAEVDQGIEFQSAILDVIKTSNPDRRLKSRNEFMESLKAALTRKKVKLPAPAFKAILSALSERDENAGIFTDDWPAPQGPVGDALSIHGDAGRFSASSPSLRRSAGGPDVGFGIRTASRSSDEPIARNADFGPSPFFAGNLSDTLFPCGV